MFYVCYNSDDILNVMKLLRRFLSFTPTHSKHLFISLSFYLSFSRFGSLCIQYIRAFYLCPIGCVTFHFESIGLWSERESCRNILNGNAHTHTHSKKIIMKKKLSSIKAKAATTITVAKRISAKKSDWNAHEYAHIKCLWTAIHDGDNKQTQIYTSFSAQL